MQAPPDPVTISTVTPVYQGASYLRDLVEAIAEVRDRLEAENRPVRLVEAVFTDDSSVDESSTVLRELAEKYPWVRVVTMSRNFGQHPATAAGILHTSSDWIATLDEDLQHHPKHVIPLLVSAATRNLDIIYAQPDGGVHQSKMRDWSSKGFKGLVSWLAKNPHIAKFNSFRVMRASVARAAASVMSQETYLDVALCWFTNRIESRPLPLRDQRFIEEGKSSYNFRSLLGHAQRMLTSSRIRMLRIGAGVGFLAMLVAGVMAVAYIGARLAGAPDLEQYRGWTSLFVTTSFFGGLTCFLLGIMLEHMSIASLQSQGRPTFFAIDRRRDEDFEAMLDVLEREDCSY